MSTPLMYGGSSSARIERLDPSGTGFLVGAAGVEPACVILFGVCPNRDVPVMT